MFMTSETTDPIPGAILQPLMGRAGIDCYQQQFEYALT
jgi:hypothetical protein